MTITIYTDSRYNFTMTHVYRDLYRERGLLTPEEKEIQSRKEILTLLEAICLPKRVTIMHCKEHQKKGGGFLWSQKQWNSWLGSLGSGLRMSGTSWSLNSPARTQITGPLGTPQGILTGSNKNWPHELTQDEGCCQMSDTSSHMSGKEAGYRSPPSHWSREHKTELVRLRYFIPNLKNVIENTHFWMFHLCPGKP